MLEWYRVGFDDLKLMDETDQLIQLLLDAAPAHKITYADLFLKFLDINPHTSNITLLQNCAQ